MQAAKHLVVPSLAQFRGSQQVAPLAVLLPVLQAA